MAVNNSELREQVDGMLNAGLWMKSHAALAELWRQRPTLSTASYVVSCYERLRMQLPLVVHRLAVLRSFTVEPVVPLLRAAAFVSGIDLTVQVGDFNAYAQEILDEHSNLYQFAPSIVVLAAQTRDVAPELWRDFADLSETDIKAAVERIVNSFRSYMQAFRSRSQAHLVVHSLEMPPFASKGALDARSETGQIEAIQSINRELHRLAHEHAGVYILDYDALVALHGRIRWHDERKWLTMRMPIAADHLIYLANEWMRFIHPLTGKSCKALVTDLDNTLWGGVIGEDGMNGIKLGPEYPGAAYQALQRVILDLYKRGIILAVCSKNNLADAMEVIEKHPGMLLRSQHFAALRINWKDKVQNLYEISDELNIGIDALAFLDDNPAERARVRSALPEVTVIDLPGDPIGYAHALRDVPVFEQLSLSAEDSERGRYYAEQRQRREVERTAASLEDFYRSLRMEVEIAQITPETLKRVAQLTQKTNQFNLTTRRYSEQQIASLMTSPDWRIFTLRVRDRFGDSGLVGVAIVHLTDKVSETDSFLLSCRVIGRTVETAFLCHLIQQAQAQGARHLQGWFLPTKKNAPAKDFYSAHGFHLVREEASGSLWELDLADNTVTCPEWIQIRVGRAEA